MSWLKKVVADLKKYIAEAKRIHAAKTIASAPLPAEFSPAQRPVIDALKAAICPNDHLFVPARTEFTQGCPCGEQGFVLLVNTPLFKTRHRKAEVNPTFLEFLRNRAAQ